jgi:hypothetical protein
MRLETLSSHPDNHRIYQQTDLSDLKQSLENYGQLEPIVVTTSNRIISGHRRYMAMKELGWTECEVRVVSPDNEIIALIEHNRHRQKSVQDIINEANYLSKELKKIVGRGRNARQSGDERHKGKRLRVSNELAQRLGVGITRFKQIQSISNHRPDLIAEIDSGKITVPVAYQSVRETRLKTVEGQSDKELSFNDQFKKFLKTHRPDPNEVFSSIQTVLKETYPYSLEMTGLSQERRQSLIDHLETLKSLDSHSEMLIRKQDQLELSPLSEDLVLKAKGLLPSMDELDVFLEVCSSESIKVIASREGYICSTHGSLNQEIWRVLRLSVSNLEDAGGLGRKMTGFVGFENENGFRLLGLIAFRSDSQALAARDDFIGWTTSQRSKNREHIVNLNICVPTQPFGFNFLGGKLISLVISKFISKWEANYGDRIVAVMTTSLHGHPSQYTGLKPWKSLGLTKGKVSIKPLRHEWDFWRGWLRENYSDLYKELEQRSSPSLAKINAVFSLLNIKNSEYQHSYERGVYICPLYENFADFLTNEITEKDLKPVSYDWFSYWKEKAKSRREKLEKNDQLEPDIEFNDEINLDEVAMFSSVSGRR